MKRKTILSVTALLVCATTLSACSGANNKITFKEYWFENVGYTPNFVTETLVYDVEFEKGSGLSTNNYTVEYTNGTFETKLTLEEGYYLYETSLTIDVTYLYGSETFTATDTTVSWVKFEDSALMQPISSHKEIKNHVLNSDGSALAVYDYTLDTEYATDHKTGSTKLVDNTTPKKDDKPFEIEDKYTYLDNEQLLLALRGISQTTSSGAFSVYAPFSTVVQTINVSFGSKVEGEEFSFEKNGTPFKNVVNYYPVSVSINAQSSGATQTAWIAATGDSSSNTYRNVMLQLKTPLSHNMGTLVYKLKSANFIVNS